MSGTARRRFAVVLLAVVGGLAVGACTPDPAPAPPTTVAPVPRSTVGPAPLANASKAVAYAKAQVGKTYCYAGVGPDCFDCSGLTSMAWKWAGLNTIPRTSGDQFRKYPQVGLDMLQPGDLLFPAEPNDHVMIYIGGGHVIHASSSKNAIVNILVSSYPIVYAVRPH